MPLKTQEASSWDGRSPIKLTKEEINSGGMSVENFRFPPNLKRSLFSPTPYGQNKDYPDAVYKDKARIWKEQQDYVRDLVLLQTHESVLILFRSACLNLLLVKDVPRYLDILIKHP